jgi:hypothetical protein
MNFDTASTGAQLTINGKPLYPNKIYGNNVNINIDDSTNSINFNVNGTDQIIIKDGSTLFTNKTSNYLLSVNGSEKILSNIIFCGSNRTRPPGVPIIFGVPTIFDVNYAGQINLTSTSSSNNITIGYNTGTTTSNNCIAIGNQSGGEQVYGQGSAAIGIGLGAKGTGDNSVAIGTGADGWTDSVCIGNGAGTNSEYTNTQSVAIGYRAGNTNQGTQSVAIGPKTGFKNQGNYAIEIGYNQGAVNFTQNEGAIAIGNYGTFETQNNYAISIGYEANQLVQGQNSIAIGNQSGKDNQGINSIAIGFKASIGGQGDNSIIINASGASINAAANKCYIAPIGSRPAAIGVNRVAYDPVTKELYYSTT